MITLIIITVIILLLRLVVAISFPTVRAFLKLFGRDLRRRAMVMTRTPRTPRKATRAVGPRRRGGFVCIAGLECPGLGLSGLSAFSLLVGNLDFF